LSIGDRVRAKRKAAGLSQEGLARRSGVSLNIVHRLERGVVTDPHSSTLVALATGLCVELADLIETPTPAGKASAPTGTERETLKEVLIRLSSPTQYLGDADLGGRVLEVNDEEARAIYRAAIKEADLLATELESWLVGVHPESPDWVHTMKLWSTAGQRLYALRFALLAKGGAEAVPVELTQATNTLESALGGMR
jgi:transcriptional regulator with XRE-family HTH domain